MPRSRPAASRVIVTGACSMSATGVVLSAKREPRLLEASVKVADGEVVIALPDGSITGSADPNVDAVLSEWLGHGAQLVAAEPERAGHATRSAATSRTTATQSCTSGKVRRARSTTRGPCICCRPRRCAAIRRRTIPTGGSTSTASGRTSSSRPRARASSRSAGSARRSRSARRGSRSSSRRAGA